MENLYLYLYHYTVALSPSRLCCQLCHHRSTRQKQLQQENMSSSNTRLTSLTSSRRHPEEKRMLALDALMVHKVFSYMQNCSTVRRAHSAMYRERGREVRGWRYLNGKFKGMLQGWNIF